MVSDVSGTSLEQNINQLNVIFAIMSACLVVDLFIYIKSELCVMHTHSNMHGAKRRVHTRLLGTIYNTNDT